MYQRTNRAFYSEQLLSFPGRLHITAEKVCVEVRVKENGQLKFRSFSSEEFNELRSILCEQDFHKEGFEEAYEQELYEVSKRARKIQNVLFEKNKKPNNLIRQKINNDAADVLVIDSIYEYSNEPSSEKEDLREEISSKNDTLGNIVAGLT